MPPPCLPAATRESAFVHAIASAGVAFAVTRSCAEGTSTICGCDSHHKGPPGEGWKWGGCSEDADFGVLVSREFADARENRPDARSAMNKHNNEAGRTVSRRRPPRDPAPGPLLADLVGPGLPAHLFPLDQAWLSPLLFTLLSPWTRSGLCQARDASPGSVGAPWSRYHPAHPVCSCGTVKSRGRGFEFSLHPFVWWFDLQRVT